jgi:hypothetical protein
MNNKKGSSVAIVILIFLLAISCGLNMYSYKEITTLKSKNDTLEQKVKDKESQMDSKKEDTGYTYNQPKTIEDIKTISIKNNQNNITIYNTESKTIEYYSYDNTGSRIDKFKKSINNNILQYTVDRVMPNLTEKECHTDWVWCVSIDATGGGCALGSNTTMPAWFTDYLDALEYSKVFPSSNSVTN